MNEKARQAAITAVYDKLHENKLGAHWLWCVIEKIAAGESEEDAMREYGYYARAALAAQPGAAWKHDCAGLCVNNLELWINHCPHCGKPRAAQHGSVISDESAGDLHIAYLAGFADGKKARPAAPTEAKPAQDAVDAERLIAGALFDFLGFLTTSERQWTFSSYDEASPAVEALEQWAKKRNLSLNEADVSGWSAALGRKEGQP